MTENLPTDFEELLLMDRVLYQTSNRAKIVSKIKELDQRFLMNGLMNAESINMLRDRFPDLKKCRLLEELYQARLKIEEPLNWIN